MKYFIMQPDKKLKNTIMIKLTEKQLENNNAQVIFADLDSDKDLPDFIMIQKLTKRAFIVSDLLKNMLDVYADVMRTEPFILADPRRRIQKNYWKVHLEEIDCLQQEESGQSFKKKEIVIDESKTMKKFIFSIRKEDVQYWIASLPFAENFLRKNMFGVEWFPLQTMSGGECVTDE